MINLKKKLKNRELTIGSWITIENESIAEIMATCGFDWIAVDMEHSAITMSGAQKLIRTIELCDVVPLVRIGENNATIIKRVLDAGSHGIIVPMVNSLDDAKKALDAVHYPPKGTRGVGLSRAQGYGTNFQKYVEWSKSDLVVIVQIEHIRAVENLESILSVDGIDGLIIGPYDLSGSLGRPGDFEHPEFQAAMAEIHRVCKKIDFPLGSHVVSSNASLVEEKIKAGYKLIAYGVDFLFLGDICRQGINTIRKIQRRKE